MRREESVIILKIDPCTDVKGSGHVDPYWYIEPSPVTLHSSLYTFEGVLVVHKDNGVGVGKENKTRKEKGSAV